MLSDALVLSHYSHGAAPHTHFSSWSKGGAAVGVQGAGAAPGAQVRGHADPGEGDNDEKGEVGDVRVGGVGRGGTLAQLGGSGDLGPVGSPLPPGPELHAPRCSSLSGGSMLTGGGGAPIGDTRNYGHDAVRREKRED